MEEKEYKRFTISLPPDLYEEFENFRKKLDLPRSDLIRKAMKSFMISEENISMLSGNVVGCITMIMAHEHFDVIDQLSINKENIINNSHDSEHEHNHAHDHEHSDLHDHLEQLEYSTKPIYADTQKRDLLLSNDIQHHFRDVIVSTMHIHLEFEKCLEIIAVSGPYERVKRLHQDLKKLKSTISSGFFVVEKEESLSDGKK